MRVFVTGATGFIGSAVVPDLIGAGHSVLALARSEANEKALAAVGADVHKGSLEDIESLKSGAAQADGVIHLGFIHDFANFAENGQIDRRAIEAMGGVLEGTNKPLIVTSGVAMVAPGRMATEKDDIPAGHAVPRVSEAAVFAFTSRGVRPMAVRMPQVHGGQGKAGLLGYLYDVAREKGVSAYVGEGKDRWAAGHRLDVARLYRLALEKGVAGARYHAVGEEGVASREIAEVFARDLDVPAVSISLDDAKAHFGWLSMFAGIDSPASSALTQQWLGWKPTQIGLLEDIGQPGYFTRQ